MAWIYDRSKQISGTDEACIELVVMLGLLERVRSHHVGDLIDEELADIEQTYIERLNAIGVRANWF